jgi:hypothetical protein
VIADVAYRAWHTAVYLGPCSLGKRKEECPLFCLRLLASLTLYSPAANSYLGNRLGLHYKQKQKRYGEAHHLCRPGLSGITRRFPSCCAFELGRSRRICSGSGCKHRSLPRTARRGIVFGAKKEARKTWRKKQKEKDFRAGAS